MSTYTTRKATFISLAVVILIVTSLLSFGQALAVDDGEQAEIEEIEQAEIEEVEASALGSHLRGGAGEMRVLSGFGYGGGYTDTQPHTIASMEVTVPKNKSQFLIVEFSSDVICKTASAGACKTTILVDGAELYIPTVIQVGGTAALEFRAPISVRRNTVCLSPGQHTVEVRWQNSYIDVRSDLGNWMLTTYQSSTCVQG